MTGRVKEDNDKIEASVSRTALCIWQRFGRRIFCGKNTGFRVLTIPSVTCQLQKRENAAAHDFVGKSVGHFAVGNLKGYSMQLLFRALINWALQVHVAKISLAYSHYDSTGL